MKYEVALLIKEFWENMAINQWEEAKGKKKQYKSEYQKFIENYSA